MWLTKCSILCTAYAATWTQCTKLDAKIGVAEIICHNDICRQKCKPGYYPAGAKVTRCKGGITKGYHWNKVVLFKIMFCLNIFRS